MSQPFSPRCVYRVVSRGLRELLVALAHAQPCIGTCGCLERPYRLLLVPGVRRPHQVFDALLYIGSSVELEGFDRHRACAVLCFVYGVIVGVCFVCGAIVLCWRVRSKIQNQYS